jgi:hypothetical protein
MFRRSLKKLSDKPQVTVKDYDRVSESDSNSRDATLHKVKDEACHRSGIKHIYRAI